MALTPTPMMQQYLQIHEKYPDCLLFFRLGDFYELFFEDAKTASRELELTLTGKDCGLEERAPMCGVPYHAVNTYVEKLISKGYKVAICEQLEDPALAKGLVERDVIRVITAGTVTDPEMLQEKDNNFLVSVAFGKLGAEGKPGACAVAAADLSTGEFMVSEPAPAALRAELDRLSASEILCADPELLRKMVDEALPALHGAPSASYQPRAATRALCDHFHLANLEPLGLAERPEATAAAGSLLIYLSDTQKNSLDHLKSLRLMDMGQNMLLDSATRRNLELTESLRGHGRKGTLLSLLDQTVTAMGGRLLKSWIDQPLLRRDDIVRRHDAVAELTDNPLLAASLREELSGVYDLERLLSKVTYHNLNARDCLALCASLEQIPVIEQLLVEARSAELQSIRSGLDALDDLTELLKRAIHPDAPILITEGGIIRDGYSAELDEYRLALTDGKQWVLDLEAREREATGIRNLRVQYNRVFGYYIEVTKSFLSQVPERYIRRQTLANAERYVTPELKEMEQKIIGAREQSMRLELRIFNEIRDCIATRMAPIQRNCAALKKLL